MPALSARQKISSQLQYTVQCVNHGIVNLIMKGWGGVEDLRYQRQRYLFNFLVTAASGLNLFFFSIQDITTFNICLSFSIDVSTIKL